MDVCLYKEFFLTTVPPAFQSQADEQQEKVREATKFEIEGLHL